MTIVSRAGIQLALRLAMGRGQSGEEAIAAVAEHHCLPVEAVREVAEEIAEEV